MILSLTKNKKKHKITLQNIYQKKTRGHSAWKTPTEPPNHFQSIHYLRNRPLRKKFLHIPNKLMAPYCFIHAGSLLHIFQAKAGNHLCVPTKRNLGMSILYSTTTSIMLVHFISSLQLIEYPLMHQRRKNVLTVNSLNTTKSPENRLAMPPWSTWSITS